MESLEEYFAHEHPLDTRDIEDIEQLLGAAVRVFLSNFHSTFAWPYDVRLTAEQGEHAVRSGKQDSLSQSTTAMVLGALLRYLGAFKTPPSTKFGEVSKAPVFPIELGDNLRAELISKVSAAATLLVEKLSDKVREKPLPIRPAQGVGGLALTSVPAQSHPEIPHAAYEFQTNSGTFGKNDVFTLAWLAEVSKADWGMLEQVGQSARWNEIAESVYAECDRRLKNSDHFENPAEMFLTSTGEPMRHAFPPLRLLQAMRRLKAEKLGALPKYYKYFEACLHEHLSFSSIPDSRFDPAEMMFCLEGMLLCQRNVVDRTLFDRVLSVLESVQSDNAYWRPVKPYLSSNRGLVLLPVSIEVANSLLRSCQIFDGDALHDAYGSRCIKLLRRYLRWLNARAVRFGNKANVESATAVADGGDLVGWHSEHVNDPTVIHMWETSQVMEFLMAYRNALHLHIARTTLVRSRFSSKPFKQKSWDKLQKQYEPVVALGEGLEIYKDIGVKVITPHQNEAPINYSILLYGPPGTGKTTVAESIAHALGRRLITITVSDFLAEGSVQVEARAKSIFEVLMAQPNCVVLFDEIDHFLLDRDSDRYTKQDTVFQFMTPGMLTKLNDLRRSKRALFIVATNYEDRIDVAIKRTGRIDLRYVVLPPDATARAQILRNFYVESKISELKDFGLSVEEEKWKKLARAATFLGYKDMEAVFNDYRSPAKFDMDKFEQDLANRGRTTRLDAYLPRLEKAGNGPPVPLEPRECPLREFIYLLALFLETKTLVAGSGDEKAVKAAREVLKKDGGHSIFHIKQIAPELSDEYVAKVEKTFATVSE